MAFRALTIPHGWVHTVRVSPLLHWLMTLAAKAQLIILEKLHVPRRMRIVTRAAFAFCQRLMHVGLGKNPGHVTMTIQADLLLVHRRKLRRADA